MPPLSFRELPADRLVDVDRAELLVRERPADARFEALGEADFD